MVGDTNQEGSDMENQHKMSDESLIVLSDILDSIRRAAWWYPTNPSSPRDIQNGTCRLVVDLVWVEKYFRDHGVQMPEC